MKFKNPTVHHELAVTVRSAESPLRNPLLLLIEFVHELWACRDLVWILFTRDLKAMYRQSYLGYLWIIVPPLMTSGVWLFLDSQKIVRVAETPIPYPAYLLIGTTLWSTFTAAMAEPLNSFNSGRTVFMKLKVPPEAFILAGMSKVVFDFLVRFILLMPILLALGVYPKLTSILFPFAVFSGLLLFSAIGIILIPLGSLYQDISRAATTAVAIYMYLSPVVYPPPKSGFLAQAMTWNPVTYILMAARDWLTIGTTDYAGGLIAVSSFSVALFVVAAIMVRISMPHVIERMGM